MTEALTKWQEEEEPHGPLGNALVLKCVIWMMRDHPCSLDRKRYRQGVQAKDVKDYFPTFMKLKFNKRVSFAKYQNKLRAGCHGTKDEKGKVIPYTVTMGRHKIFMDDVKEKRVHYFPLVLQEDGLVDHSHCEDCSVGESKTP